MVVDGTSTQSLPIISITSKANASDVEGPFTLSKLSIDEDMQLNSSINEVNSHKVNLIDDFSPLRYIDVSLAGLSDYLKGLYDTAAELSVVSS